MKANLFAVVLSMFVLSFPVHAENSAPDALSNAAQQLKKIDLNKADAKELTHSVQGIGSKRAQAIVAYRESHGAFKSVEELAEVRGLGKQYVKNHLAQLQQTFVIE